MSKAQDCRLFSIKQTFSLNTVNIHRLENEVINDKYNHLSSCLPRLIIQCYSSVNGNDPVLFNKYLLLTQQKVLTMNQVVVGQVKGNHPKVHQREGWMSQIESLKLKPRWNHPSKT